MRGWSKLALFAFLFALVSASFASAEYKSIHKDWHIYNDNFVVQGIVYSLQLNLANYDQLRFTVDNVTSILRFGDCAITPDYKYCYMNYSFESAKKYTVTPNFEQAPGVQIDILKETEVVSLTIKTTLVPKANITDKINLRTTITNKGAYSLSGMTLAMGLPSGVTITNPKSFTQSGNELNAAFNLGSDAEKVFDFEFQPAKYGTMKFNYTLVYVENGAAKTKKGTMMTEVVEPYLFSYSVDPLTVDIQKPVSLTLNLENIDADDDLKIHGFTVRVNPSWAVSSAFNLYNSAPGLYSTSIKKLVPREEKEFRLQFKPAKAGTYAVNGTLLLEINGVNVTENFTKSMKVELEGLTPEIYFARETIPSGTDIELSLDLYNLNPDFEFRDIKVAITSPVFNGSYAHNALLPEDKVELVRERFMAPEYDKDTKLEFKSSTTYKSTQGVTFQKNASRSITILGKGKLVDIKKTISKKSAIPGDEIIVDVSVKSLVDNYIQNVIIAEEFGPGLQLLSGKTEAVMSLLSKEEKKAYSYKVKVPDPYYYNTTNFSTNVTIGNEIYDKYVFNTVNILNASKYIEKLNETEEEETNASIGPRNPKPEEKSEGFLSKMFRGIGSFFSRLFGGE